MRRRDLEEAGAALARRVLLRWRRPMNDELFDLMTGSMRRGFERELEALGVCPHDAHQWEPDRVTCESLAAILTIRSIGEEIETCRRCGVWRDKGGRR